MVQSLHIYLKGKKTTCIIFYQWDIFNELFTLRWCGVSVLFCSVTTFSVISRHAWEPGQGHWELQQQQLQHWGLCGFLWTGQFLLPHREMQPHTPGNLLCIFIPFQSCYTLLYFTSFLCSSLGMPQIIINCSGFFSKRFVNLLNLKSGSRFILSYSQMSWVMLSHILSTGSEKPTAFSY